MSADEQGLPVLLYFNIGHRGGTWKAQYFNNHECHCYLVVSRVTQTPHRLCDYIFLTLCTTIFVQFYIDCQEKENSFHFCTDRYVYTLCYPTIKPSDSYLYYLLSSFKVTTFLKALCN